jgi:hypothetical protein
VQDVTIQPMETEEVSVNNADSSSKQICRSSLDFEGPQPVEYDEGVREFVADNNVSNYLTPNDLQVLIGNCSIEELVQMYVESVKRISIQMESTDKGRVLKDQLSEKVSIMSFQQRLDHLSILCHPLQNELDGNILSALICEHLPIADTLRCFASMPHDMKPKLAQFLLSENIMMGSSQHNDGTDNENVRELSNRMVGEILGKAIAGYCVKHPKNTDETCGDIFKHLAITTHLTMKSMHENTLPTDDSTFIEQACSGFLSSCSLPEQTDVVTSIMQDLLRQYTSNDANLEFLTSRMFITLTFASLNGDVANKVRDKITGDVANKVLSSTSRHVKCGTVKGVVSKETEEGIHKSSISTLGLVFGESVTLGDIAPLYGVVLKCLSSLEVWQSLWKFWNKKKTKNFTLNTLSNTSLSIIYEIPRVEIKYFISEILNWIFFGKHSDTIGDIVLFVLEHMPVHAKVRPYFSSFLLRKM